MQNFWHIDGHQKGPWQVGNNQAELPHGKHFMKHLIARPPAVKILSSNHANE